MSKREWINSLFEKEFEFYRQKESKVKPCEEKVSWWCGSPKPRLRLGDILPYIPGDQPMVLIINEEFLRTTPFRMKWEEKLLNLKLVSITVSQNDFLRLEVEE